MKEMVSEDNIQAERNNNNNNNDNIIIIIIIRRYNEIFYSNV
jgi:hypothetical protein